MPEDELNLDNLEAQADKKLEIKNRYQQLSDKVKLTAQEKEEALAKVKAEGEARTVAEKERDFYKGFSTHASKYPSATEHQDKIWDKVKAGYDIEDAMVSVLNKEGKLTASAPARPTNIEGGSAPTQMIGDKAPDQMTTAEKFAALQELDKSGELVKGLRGR